jgi:hypothetical protein
VLKQIAVLDDRLLKGIDADSQIGHANGAKQVPSRLLLVTPGT